MTDGLVGQGGAERRADAVFLLISQDAYEGDSEFVVSIDGLQIGDNLTGNAFRSLGESDEITVLGNFSLGAHQVAVSFLNDAWGGSPDTDRNLYVESACFEDRVLAGSVVTFLTDGTQPVGSFSEAVPFGYGFGSGLNTLELRISQDDWLGNAQYVISVDGVPVDGVLTAGGEHQFGNYDTVWISRDFGPGEHVVTVDFLNDAWGGTLDTDRNLYIERVSFNGEDLSDSSRPLLSGGEHVVGSFIVPPSPEPQPMIGGIGQDRLHETIAHGDVFWGGPDADVFAFGVGASINPGTPGEFYATIL